MTRLRLSEGSEETQTVSLNPNTTYYIQAKNYWVVEPYTEEGTYLFSVSAPTLTSDDVTLSATSYTYSGSACKPSVTVVYNGTTLTERTDYTVTYTNHVAAGTATVIVTGIGDYTGTVKKTFTISPVTLTADNVTLSKESYSYSGSARKPSVTVVCNGTTLTEGTDYTVGYSDNVTVGTATVTVTGKGNYTGTVKKTFTIKAVTKAKPTVTSASYSKLKIQWTKVTGASGYYVYRSTKSGSGYKLVKTITKGSTVTYTDTGRTTGTTYYYKIKAYRTTDGKKTVVATTKVGSGKTVLSAPEVKLTAGTKKVTVKVSTKVSGASGYVIYCSTKKSSGYKKVKTVTSGKAFTYKDTGLKAKTTYYYKVRAYRTVSGKKVYSAYSTVVKAKTK